MKLKQTLIIAFSSLAAVACSEGVADYHVVPLPAGIDIDEGLFFEMKSSTPVVYAAGDEGGRKSAEFFSEYVRTLTGMNLKVTDAVPESGPAIYFASPEDEEGESYFINITADKIEIASQGAAGTFYAVQTLRKSLPTGKFTSVKFPCGSLFDSPRFGYRAMHIDVARHFFSIDFLKKYIDLVALHNMNHLHLHITDDQGWRLEIKKYPKLTEIGSVRAQTVIGKNTGEYDGTPHSGFYTQEELKELVSYAAERHITIIPEIDMPGHMVAALSAYPEFGCTGGPYQVWQMWGISDDVLCVGKECTIQFVKDVLAELMEVFPSEYIHIGGDECPRDRWNECPDCQAKVKKLGIVPDKNGNTGDALQAWFTAEIEKFLNENGRKLIGWDEILSGGVAPNATIMSWRGSAGGYEAAKQGHDAIMCPNDYCYFDYYQTEERDSVPLAIGGFIPVEKIYSLEPVPEGLTKEEAAHILGVQANVWTEYIPDESHLEYMVLPRMDALSEVQWCFPGAKNYDDFVRRMKHQAQLYDLLGYNYAKDIFR